MPRLWSANAMNGPGSTATAAALRANLALLGALETYGAGLLDIIVNLAVTDRSRG